MDMHEKDINQSIDKNIIGTCNLVKICKILDIKIIYLSTNYVYPGIKGNYKENDPLLPLIIMLGQNLVVNVLYKCTKTH